MKLSESIMLGEVIMPRNQGESWLSKDCGCAIGRAYVANGGSFEEFAKVLHYRVFTEMWPWAGDCILGGISLFFSQVVAGTKTIEQLVDYVRSIEPECGECCEFTCGCVQKMDSVSDNVPAYSKA
jgi:hypothetical protein